MIIATLNWSSKAITSSDELMTNFLDLMELDLNRSAICHLIFDVATNNIYFFHQLPRCHTSFLELLKLLKKTYTHYSNHTNCEISIKNNKILAEVIVSILKEYFFSLFIFFYLFIYFKHDLISSFKT